jgi:hypothetical protein
MPCEVKSFTLSDWKLSMVDADAALLTYKGVTDGTCAGQALPPVWSSSLWVNRKGKWVVFSHTETNVKTSEREPPGIGRRKKGEPQGSPFCFYEMNSFSSLLRELRDLEHIAVKGAFDFDMQSPFSTWLLLEVLRRWRFRCRRTYRSCRWRKRRIRSFRTTPYSRNLSRAS